MCQSKAEGGARCEYAERLSVIRRKVRRSPRYKSSNPYNQNKMVESAIRRWKKDNPELVFQHLPESIGMNTRAQEWTPEYSAHFTQHFPKRALPFNQEINLERTQTLVDEYTSHDARLTDQEINSLSSYTFVGFINVNNYLRTRQCPEDFSDSGMEHLETQINALKSATQHRTSHEPRALYRHMLLPTGVKPADYAEKYFKVGSRVRDKGFLSTSEDIGYIAGHAHNRRPSQYVVFEILSSQGLSLQRKHEQVGSLQSFEKERLLPAGTNFRVVNIKNQRVRVPEDREKLHQQFAGRYSSIAPKTFTIVQLIDETDAKTLEA